MNLFDESITATLDNGGVALLDGKYLAMTPETLNQAVKDGLTIAIGDTAPEQAADEEANDSFIQHNFKCHFCGKENEATEYIMTISGGDDRDHDMESVSMEACAGCLEKMLAMINYEK